MIQLLFLVICVGDALGQNNLLYPHTQNNGDTKFFPECLDCYNDVNIADTYRFYGVVQDTAYVSSKGVLTFDGDWGWTSYVPYALQNVNMPMISPLWSDNNLASSDSGENILYRETTDTVLLARFVDDIDGYFDGCGGSDFNPNSLLIVTWQRVSNWCYDVGEWSCWWTWYGSYNREGETVEHVYPMPPGDRMEQEMNNAARDGSVLGGINGFQLVLATDGDGVTFAMFNMHTIDWNCCGNYHRSGFADGLHKYSYELPDSGTDDVSNLTTGSNVGKAGRWVFRVDPCNILGPQCEWLES